MRTYIDENGRSVQGLNYMDAAEKLYGQGKGINGCPTTYSATHRGFATVKVFEEGAKIGSFYGVQAAQPELHTLRIVK